MITTTTTFLDSGSAALRRLEARAPAVADRAAKARGERWQGVTQSKTPLGRGRNPGGLIAAWQLTPVGAGAVRLHNDASYLKYVVRGRPAIVAPPGKALHFWIDGQEFFRKRVGPAKANPFVERAFAEARRGDAADAAQAAQWLAAELRP